MVIEQLSQSHDAAFGKVIEPLSVRNGLEGAAAVRVTGALRLALNKLLPRFGSLRIQITAVRIQAALNRFLNAGQTSPNPLLTQRLTRLQIESSSTDVVAEIEAVPGITLS